MVIGTGGHRRCTTYKGYGEIDEVCRCTGHSSSSSSGTAGVEDHKEVVAGLQT